MDGFRNIVNIQNFENDDTGPGSDAIINANGDLPINWRRQSRKVREGPSGASALSRP